MTQNDKITTHFGFEKVSSDEKAAKVGAVFDSVADRYDVMNDVMSLGLHRRWKAFAIKRLQLRPHQCILDIAGGTGDLTANISPAVGDDGRVVLADINGAMLARGRDRLLNRGLFRNIQFVQTDAEKLPFSDNYFDRIIMGFGLRNVTDKLKALQEFYRVLKPGGFVIILEFSTPKIPLINKIYDQYSFKLLPWLGGKIAKDEKSYRYLAESIRMHPDQEALSQLMREAKLEDVKYYNLTAGIVAVHQGYKY